MKRIFIGMIIIAVMLVGGLTFIGYHLSERNGEYYELETTLKEEASRYFGQFPGRLPTRSSIVTAAELIEEGFLEDFNMECTGYVEVKKSGMFYNYTPFLNCPNYSTRKYNPDNDKEIIVITDEDDQEEE